jgi:TRAP-type mannitol/chloroaromatic compound transport system permease small subunit
MGALVRGIERLTGSVGIMASFALVPLILATCYEVFARYVMGAPTIWAYEIGYVLTGGHFLLGMAFTLRSNEHIRIDIFSGRFSERTRAVIDLLGYTVMLPLMVWLSYALFQHLAAGYLRSERSGHADRGGSHQGRAQAQDRGRALDWITCRFSCCRWRSRSCSWACRWRSR